MIKNKKGTSFKYYILAFLFILVIGFTLLKPISASSFAYNYLEPNLDITSAINYSTVNVNNSQYLGGLPASSYIPYTGANQNINLGNNNLTINGTTLFVDTNNSKVGIGTTSPTTKLEIAGSSSAPSLKVSDFLQQSYSNSVSFISNNLYYNGGYKYLESGVAGQSFAMDKGSFVFYYSNATGNGIDLNASPTTLLNLSADGDLYLKSKRSTRIYGWNNVYIELYNSSTGGFNFYSLNGAAESKFFGSLATTGGLTVGGTFRPGSLTIGTSDGKISGGSNYLDNAYIQMYDGATGNFDFSTGKRLQTTSYRWYTNQTQLRMTLLYNGNLGIGTSNPLTTLHSNGSILSNGTINATNGFGVGSNSGLTGNYSLGECWQKFTGGILTATNCTEL